MGGSSSRSDRARHEQAPARVYRDVDYRLAPRDHLTVRTEGLAAYGWSFRPANCGASIIGMGTYECVDARAVLPPQ